MRSRLVFFNFLGAAVISAPAAAQSNQQRCAELRAEMQKLLGEILPEMEKASHALEVAGRRVDALEGSSGHPVFSALLDQEPYSASGMLRFRQEYALSGDLTRIANSGRPRDFWRLAEAEINRRRDRQEKIVYSIYDRLHEEAEYLQLNCDSAPVETSAALPVDRRPDGQPIITDELITRWVKASYALKNTGGAYWQAGRMTQLDYLAITGRMRDFSSLGCTQSREGEVTRVTCRITAANRASLERYFTPEEIAALAARQDDLGSALSTPGS